MTGPRRSAKPPPLPPPRAKPQRERVDVPKFDPAQPLLDLEEHSATKTYDRFEADLPMPDLKLPPRDGLGPIPMGDSFPETKTQVAAIPTGGTSATAHSPAPPKRRARPIMRYLVLGGVAAAAWGTVAAASQLGDHQSPQPPAAAVASAEAASKPAAPRPKAEEQPSGDAEPEPEPEPEGKPAAPPTDSPRVAWSFAAEQRPIEIAVAPGAIAVHWEDRVAGFVDGAQAWESDGAVESLVALPDGSVLVTGGGKARALSAADGSTAFEVELPMAKRAKKPPQVVAAAVKNDAVLLAFADARFVRLTTASCAADPAACLQDVGALRGEYLEPSAQVAVGREGMRFLVEDESLRAFDIGFEEAFSVEADAALINVSPVTGGRLVLGFGDELALLDTARCAGRATVRLGKQTSGPSGCVLWRFGGELDIRGATAIDAETVAVNGKGRLQAIAEGEDSWKSPLSSLGPVVVTGDGESSLLTLARGSAEEQSTLSLIAVDPSKGTVLWTLPLETSFDELPATDELSLQWQPGWVGVSAGPQLALVELPATP